MTHDRFARILAVELRHRKLGFAVIERPKALLDFGVRTFGAPHNASRVLGSLIRSCVPCAVVVKRADHKMTDHRRDVTTTVRVIREECVRRTIPFEMVDVQEVRRAFPNSTGVKEDIAQAVAEQFLELRWKLPPTRHKRSWVNEGWNMPVFDAVATGLTFLIRTKHPKSDTHSG